MKPTPSAVLLRWIEFYHPRMVMMEQLQPLLRGGATRLFANAVVALIVATVGMLMINNRL